MARHELAPSTGVGDYNRIAQLRRVDPNERFSQWHHHPSSSEED
jgi:hypothetical protein